MAEGLDFGALWPVPAGRFGWTARGNAPCLMEIVSWLTTGAIDTAWPGVSPGIAEYVQAAQDAMDDEPRQKLLISSWELNPSREMWFAMQRPRAGCWQVSV